ncbi:hypothetical protein TNCV_3078761 [Trichonephila clavipes]|nr:hypothetical protein TNCV_3078761 [Trichonephila clavipes]
MSYSGFEPTGLQVEGHIHHTGWMAKIENHASDSTIWVGSTRISRETSWGVVRRPSTIFPVPPTSRENLWHDEYLDCLPGDPQTKRDFRRCGFSTPNDFSSPAYEQVCCVADRLVETVSR